jgi:hypothetical protein
MRAPRVLRYAGLNVLQPKEVKQTSNHGAVDGNSAATSRIVNTQGKHANENTMPESADQPVAGRRQTRSTRTLRYAPY